MATQNTGLPFDFQGSSAVTRSGADKFPNPFFDIASEYVPSDLNQIFELTEFLMMTMAPFRAVTQRVVRYFLTEIVLEGGEDEDREHYEALFNSQMKLIDLLGEVGDDYMCFAGDTLVSTQGGIVPIRDLEDKDVMVLSQGGVYRKAHFKCYGEQDLIRIRLADGTDVFATPEHRWPVIGRTEFVPTSSLCLHDSLILVDEDAGEFGSVEVVGLELTDRHEKVYCCNEPETHTFCLGNGVLTSNCYGNVFLSLFLPFDRMLICPDCKTNYHVETDLKWKFKEGKFEARCPKCGYRGAFDHKDRRSPDSSRVRLIRWNPKFMRLRVHPISGRTEYFLEMDRQFIEKIRSGNPFYLNDTPWSMIECAMRPKDNLFQFREGQLFHLRAGSLSGLPIRGWGLPPMLPNFKLAYYIQLLRRYDEAITLDYIVPFRVLFPQAQTADGKDALSMMNMGTFVAQMTAMVDNHRKQITDVQVAPFPVGYQMLGGEAKALSPKDSITAAFDELFTSMGYPVELYKGTLSLQAAPVALRLFEKEQCHLVYGYNDILEWIVSLIGRYFRWETKKIEVKLRPVTLADDIERKALMVQAAAGADISKGTAYRAMGIDFMEEQKRVVEEQKEIAKLQQKAQEEMTQQPLDGSGGENAGPGAVVGASPTDVAQQGEAIARQLVAADPTQRRKILIDVLHSNPTLHAMIMQSLDQMRQGAASQGRQMLASGQMQL